jgi:hypothetical protein
LDDFGLFTKLSGHTVADPIEGWRMQTVRDCQIFLGTINQNWGKIYLSKHKMAIKYNNIFQPRSSKYTQVEFFGKKQNYHLATPKPSEGKTDIPFSKNK